MYNLLTIYNTSINSLYTCFSTKIKLLYLVKMSFFLIYIVGNKMQFQKYMRIA